MRILVSAVLIVLTGCSSTPMTAGESAPVPADRILSQAWARPGKDTGTLVLKRDGGFGGSGCNWTVSVNGADIAVLATGETFAIYPPAGELFVSARPRAALCPGATVNMNLILQPNKVRFVRLSMDWTGSVTLQQTPN